MNDPVTWRGPVLMALAAGLLLRLYFIFVTPVAGPSVPGQLSSYNDEIAHVNYIHHVAVTDSLPEHVESIQGDSALVQGHYENYQPPLYYVAVARLFTLFGLSGTGQITLIARLVNLPLYAGLLLLLIAIGREVGAARIHQNAALIFLSLNGVAVRFTSTASNDALFWLFAGAMIFTALRMWNLDAGGKYLVIFALLAIAGIYTKLSALILLPLPLLTLARSAYFGRFAGLLIMYAFIGILTGPVWMRNVAEFGSWLPLAAGFGAPDYGIPQGEAVIYAIRSLVFPWSEFWSGLIGIALMLPILIWMALSVLHRSVWGIIRRQPVLSIGFLVAFAAFVWLNIQYHQAEARYLFAAWPAAILFLSHPVRENEGSLWLFVLALALPYALFYIPRLGI